MTTNPVTTLTAARERLQEARGAIHLLRCELVSLQGGGGVPVKALPEHPTLDFIVRQLEDWAKEADTLRAKIKKQNEKVNAWQTGHIHKLSKQIGLPV